MTKFLAMQQRPNASTVLFDAPLADGLNTPRLTYKRQEKKIWEHLNDRAFSLVVHAFLKLRADKQLGLKPLKHYASQQSIKIIVSNIQSDISNCIATLQLQKRYRYKHRGLLSSQSQIFSSRCSGKVVLKGTVNNIPSI